MEAGFALRLLVRQRPRDGGYASAETIVGSLDDEAALKHLVAGSAAVIHLAGAIAAPDRARFFAVNDQGTRKLARMAMTAGVPRFIHVSSLAAREPQLSDYAASKRAAEDGLLELKPYGLVIVRPPVVYGPGDRATLPLFDQLTRRTAVIPGSAGARFSLIYVEDLVRFLVERITDDAAGLIEIDDGHGGYSWTELLAMTRPSEGRATRPVYLPRWLIETLAFPLALVGSALKLRVPLTPGKVRELYHADWVAHPTPPQPHNCIDFTEGFRRTVAWYREQGWLPGKIGTDRKQPAKAYGEMTK